MTDVVTNFVENRASEQVTRRNSFCRAPLFECPLSPFPGKPVSHLRVSRKEQNAARLTQLEGQRQTGIIGVRVQSQRKRTRGPHPVVLDPSPFLTLQPIILREEFLRGAAPLSHFGFAHPEPLPKRLLLRIGAVLERCDRG